MCLSIPANIVEIEGDNAKVSVGGAISNANVMMIDNVKIGDYILVHAGFALEKIDEEESLEDSLVTPVEPTKEKKSLGKKEEEILIQALGEDMAARVMEEALISVTKLEDTNRFEVTVDRNESPSTLFYYNDDEILMDGSIEKSSKLYKILKKLPKKFKLS